MKNCKLSNDSYWESYKNEMKKFAFRKCISLKNILLPDSIEIIEEMSFAFSGLTGHYKIFCVNGNTGFKFESRIFYFIDLQNEEDYERKESSSAR